MWQTTARDVGSVGQRYYSFLCIISLQIHTNSSSSSFHCISLSQQGGFLLCSKRQRAMSVAVRWFLFEEAVLQAELTLLKNTKRWQNVSAILMIWKIVDYVHYLKKTTARDGVCCWEWCLPQKKISQIVLQTADRFTDANYMWLGDQLRVFPWRKRERAMSFWWVLHGKKFCFMQAAKNVCIGWRSAKNICIKDRTNVTMH